MDVNLIKKHLSYDPELGILTWIKPTSNRKSHGSVAGCVSPDGYVKVRLASKLYYAHRIAWLLQTGQQPPKFLDHINRQRADNRWKNLRAATVGENNRNLTKRKGCSSSFKGVVWNKAIKKWVVSVSIDQKSVHLGVFSSEVEAAKVYDTFVLTNYGEFAAPNFIDGIN